MLTKTGFFSLFAFQMTLLSVDTIQLGCWLVEASREIFKQLNEGDIKKDDGMVHRPKFKGYRYLF
jgi:hypothetical protein